MLIKLIINGIRHTKYFIKNPILWIKCLCDGKAKALRSSEPKKYASYIDFVCHKEHQRYKI